MPRIAYIDKNFRQSSLDIIALADEICTAYSADGLDLTLRQLYYQFISRDFFPNTQQNYDRLGSIISDARLAGLIDWRHLTDRGRHANSTGWFGMEEPTAEGLVREAAESYAFDLAENQPRRIEVWVEKEALIDVIQKGTQDTRTVSFACKGYVSQSEMWAAGRRLSSYIRSGQDPLILHLGDHDPSGLDMTRDIRERLSMFVGDGVEVRRIALNMDQIEQYAPPPNHAKTDDGRFDGYAAEFGTKSWELDSLEPKVLIALIKAEILSEFDVDAFAAEIARENEGRAAMEAIADRWPEVLNYLEENPTDED